MQSYQTPVSVGPYGTRRIGWHDAVQPMFRPDGEYAAAVETALSCLPDGWHEGEMSIVTYEGLTSQVPVGIVEITDDMKVLWGELPAHFMFDQPPLGKVRILGQVRCKLVPFALKRGSHNAPIGPSMTDVISLVLWYDPVHRQHVVVDVLGGDYPPDLPWMPPTDGADRERLRLDREFWAASGHARVWYPGAIVGGTTRVEDPRLGDLLWIYDRYLKEKEPVLVRRHQTPSRITA